MKTKTLTEQQAQALVKLADKADKLQELTHEYCIIQKGIDAHLENDKPDKDLISDTIYNTYLRFADIADEISELVSTVRATA